MPALTFVLPHWLYWAGLLLFPLAAMMLVRREARRGTPREPTLFSAYLFWFFAGFAGLHRFYLRSAWGFVFAPLLVGILYCNDVVRDTREDVSRTRASFEEAQGAVARARPAPDGKPTDDERAVLAKAESDLRAEQGLAQAAVAEQERWLGYTRAIAGLLAALLLVDAALIPGLVRRRRADPAEPLAAAPSPAPIVHEAGTGEDPSMSVHTRITDAIEWVNVHVGEFVAYWAVIAVFAYYYEVLARYVFNSPTNWVHESMFLMFGMQYMLSGAYAYREDQHVRVDVLYTKLSTRGKAIADIISSVFFFIFTLTMLWTGWRFALDAINNGETSFTEWGIQYWPVKIAIPLGAGLIVLQGVSKLLKDILIATGRTA